MYSHVCFIDYSKAFDIVNRALLFDLLSSLDIQSYDIKLLANLYWNQQAAVPKTTAYKRGTVMSSDLQIVVISSPQTVSSTDSGPESVCSG